MVNYEEGHLHNLYPGHRQQRFSTVVYVRFGTPPHDENA
jgi:hypothetical protein